MRKQTYGFLFPNAVHKQGAEEIRVKIHYEPAHKYRLVMYLRETSYSYFIGWDTLPKTPVPTIGQWLRRFSLISSAPAAVESTHRSSSNALEISLLIKPIVGLNRSAIVRMINNPLRITTVCGSNMRTRRPIFLNTVVPRFLFPFCDIHDIADWPAASGGLIDHFAVENHDRRLAPVQIIGLPASQLIEQLR